MPDQMLAARVHQAGAALSIEHVELPQAGPGVVPVRMMYAGINPIDSYVRAGAVGDPSQLPRVLGVEGVGTVDDRVYVVYGAGVGIARDGTWANCVAAPAGALVAVPDGVDPVQAAAAGVVGATALRTVVDAGQVGAADTVLVLGAAGGVGSAAISLARARGATVLGQVGGAYKAEFVATLGAEPVVAADPDALRKALSGREVTVALDPLGGGYTGALVDLLPVGGRLISYGVSAGAQVELDMRALYRKNLTVVGYGGVTQSPERVREAIEGALSAIADGSMTIPVDAVLPLAQADKALEALADRRPRGKLVLDLR